MVTIPALQPTVDQHTEDASAALHAVRQWGTDIVRMLRMPAPSVGCLAGIWEEELLAVDLV